MRRKPLAEAADELDLVPLIDVCFLILLFFILCGRLSIQERSEQVTVPPTRTARAPVQAERIVLSITGGALPRIALGADGAWMEAGDPRTWPAVRAVLDRAWERAGKREADGRTIADAMIEIRADAEAPFRLVQQAQQVASDSVDPASFLPRDRPLRPFAQVDLTGSDPG